MDNLSYKHHFIPRFYLENFTNSEGSFYIYLVKENRFKRNGELFTPKSHFFMQHGNTVNFQPHLPDYLETQHYTPIDTDASLIIRKIRDSVNLGSELTSLEMVQINYFISHLYWRSPLRDEDAKKLLNEKSLQELGFVFKGDEEEVKKAELLFRTNPDFFKIVKWMLPLGLHHINLEIEFYIEIMHFKKIHGANMLGDNPIILSKEKNIDSYSEEMIVPLTSNDFYIRSNTKKVYFDESLKAIVDLIQLKQANEYICVTDKDYIDRLKYMDAQFNLTIRDLKELLFYGLTKDKG